MDSESPLNARIAARVRELRTARGQSLEALATAAGVSRSMISLVERAETSATAVVLEKIATGLGVTFASLFEPGEGADSAPASPLARHADQVEWQDTASGYRRRNVSPAGIGSPVQVVDVHFPAGARVTFDTGLTEGDASQHVWVLDGVMELTVGSTMHRLAAGDCLWMPLALPRVFHNPGPSDARYAVILHTAPAGVRRA